VPEEDDPDLCMTFELLNGLIYTACGGPVICNNAARINAIIYSAGQKYYEYIQDPSLNFVTKRKFTSTI